MIQNLQAWFANKRRERKAKRDKEFMDNMNSFLTAISGVPEYRDGE